MADDVPPAAGASASPWHYLAPWYLAYMIPGLSQNAECGTMKGVSA